jgi:hypothetical protein
MSKGDRIIEQGAERLRGLSDKARARGGLVGKLAEPLAEDSAFLRKLKPSLIKARARGEQPAEPAPMAAPAPGSARDGASKSQAHGKGRKPLPLIGAAFGAGVAAAKLLDWRGHAHPRA